MTTTSFIPKAFAWEIKFLESIKTRAKNDNGVKAAFKRAMSGEPEHIRKIYEFVLPYLGPVTEWEQNHVWIPVACLSVYYPQTIREAEQQHKRNFGHSCRGLASATNSEGADRRFRALLDLALSDIQSPLTALVRQMKARGIAINYAQLLADLRRWEHPDQYIQDQWARAFWGAERSPQAIEMEATSNE